MLENKSKEILKYRKITVFREILTKKKVTKGKEENGHAVLGHRYKMGVIYLENTHPPFPAANNYQLLHSWGRGSHTFSNLIFHFSS